MLPPEIENKLEGIKAEIAKLGAELVDIAIHRTLGRSVMTVIADKEGGITLDDCARINHRLSAYFDESLAAQGGFFSTPYLLEVNSPGLDRPLRGEKELLKAKGKRVKVIYRSEDGRTRDCVADIQEVKDGAATFKDSNDKIFTVKIEAIVRAVREIGFDKK